MKKIGKVFLIIALVMMVLGAGTCFATFAAAGFDYRKFTVGNEDLSAQSLEQPVGNATTLVISDLTAADIDFDVKIVPSADDKLHVDCASRRGNAVTLTARGDELVLTSAGARDWRFHIGIFRLGSVPLTVAVPDAIANVRFHDDAADLRCEGLKPAGNLTLDIDAAKVTLSDCDFAGDILIGVNAGDVALRSVTAANVTADLDTARLRLSDVAAANIDLRADYGDMELNGIDIGNSLRIAADVANIKGTVVGKADDFTVVSHVDVGKNNLRNSGTQGSKTIAVAADTGKVDIRFSEGGAVVDGGDGVNVDIDGILDEYVFD